MRTLVVWASVAWACWAAQAAVAQSLFGNRGPASQIGTNARGSFAGRSTTLGTNVLSGTGALSLGGLSTGLTTPGGLTIGTQSGTGQLGRAEGFIGRDDSAGRFVGDQRVGQQRLRRSAPGGFFGLENLRRGRFSAPRGSPSTLPGASGTATIVFRPQQRVAFQYRRPAPTQIQSLLVRRLQRLAAQRPGWNGVQLHVSQQGTVVLRGQVRTAEEKKLLIALVRLEPGVRQVRDELQVVQP